MLDGALREGIGFPSGCRNGQCGTCKARLREGEYRYLDGYSPDVLSRTHKKTGWMVCCKATPVSDLCIELPFPLEEHFEPRILVGRVARIEALAPDVMRLIVRLPEGEAFPYHPGQHVAFHLEDGERRAFSLATPPSGSGKLEFHIRRIPGGRFSNRLLDELRPGEPIRFEGPLGSFRLDARSTRPILFVAGGTGMAPIKAMVERSLGNGLSNPIWIYWGTRRPKLFYLPGIPKCWDQEEHERVHYVPVVLDSDESWPGRTGPVHIAVVEDHPNLSGFDVYMAGPPGMIKAAKEVFPAYGLPEDRLFSDPFVPAVTSGGEGESPFRSRLRRLLRKHP